MTNGPKKRGLGRGLDALLGVGNADREGREAPAGSVATLPVDLIQRGRFQPRRDFNAESLQELADSIRAQGVVQPVVVRPVGEGRYELIAGERRWRAAQMAGLHDIPAVVRDVPDQTAMAMGLIENIQRDDLNPLEEATALQRLLDEFGLTHQEVAQAVGKSRATVSNLLRLLDLNEDVKAVLESRQLEMGHARALLGLHGAVQSEAAGLVARKGLSVRETEALVRRLLEQAEHPQAPRREARLDPDIRRLQDNLCERLGARVEIHHGKTGRGQLVITYGSLDELDGILDRIQ
jgi:ParB family transcriptional regulator, chromosome partitioning protein